MGYYYNDPSGYGSWYVPDNTTPLQAFADILSETGATVSDSLNYSIARQSTNNDNAINQVDGKDKVSTTVPSTSPFGPKPIPPVVQPTTPAQTITPVRPKQTIPGSVPAVHKPVILPIQRALYNPGDTGDHVPDAGVDCPIGYFYDEFNDVCVPTQIVISPPGGPINNQPAYVTVNVQNAVNLSASAIDAITKTVGDAVTSASNLAIDTAKSAASDIMAGIKTVTDDIASGVNSFLTGIKNGLLYIVNLVRTHIGELISFITDHVAGILDKVAGAIDSIASFYKQHLEPILQNIQDVMNKTIVPVVNAIQQAYQTTTALINAIKDDVHNGITGILQLPGDIANSIGSIEGTLTRVFDQLGLKKKDGTSVLVGPDGKDTVWNRLENIGKGVGILGQIDVQKITYADYVKLSEPNLSRAGAKALDALVGEIGDFVRDIISGTTRSLDAAKTGIAALPLFLGIEAGTWIGTWELIRSLDRMFEPFYKFAEEDLAAKAGLAKLPVGQALEAWKRGFILDEDLKEELAVNGWDDDRIKVLKDLQSYVMDVRTALDMYFRKIVTEPDLTVALVRHGITADQQKALIEQSYRLADVNIATTAWNWKLIDGPALEAVLRQNRYTDNEISLYRATMLQPEKPEHVLNRIRLERLYRDLGFSPEGFADVPTDLVAATQRSAQDSQVAKDIWQTSFYVHPLTEWINLYFRRVRTLTEVHAAMDYYRVPHQFRDDIIRSHQSLIPWRTIPTMLANRVISEPYAKQQLEAHGFDLAAQEALIKYAGLAHAKSKAVASGDVFGLSVGVAKQYFDMGTIDDVQYKEVLLAHGYNEQSADLTIQVEVQHAKMLARKQLASDVIAEVNAGAITTDEAISQMEAAQFSPAEKSRVINSIHRQKRQAVKVPSESELHSMVKAKVISVDEYSDAMSQLGWSDAWIAVFVNWRFVNAAQTPSPA